MTASVDFGNPRFWWEVKNYDPSNFDFPNEEHMSNTSRFSMSESLISLVEQQQTAKAQYMQSGLLHCWPSKIT